MISLLISQENNSTLGIFPHYENAQERKLSKHIIKFNKNKNSYEKV